MCDVCGNYGDNFTDITEDSINADVEARLIDHPDGVAAALEAVGLSMCNICGSTSVTELDA